MNSQQFSIKWWELGIIVLLVGTVSVLLLPALARSRESARRASCQNNLKQLGLVLKMFANEDKQHALPPLSPIPDNWMMDIHAVYPEYLSDVQVLICPSNPSVPPGAFRLKNNREHPGVKVGDFHPDCVWALCYIYTGYAIWSDEQALALADAYRDLPAGALAGDIEVSLSYSEADTGEPGPDKLPLVWDRIVPDEAFPHAPNGGNVLYGDGHVEFHQYSWYAETAQFPITPAAAEAFGTSVPELAADCYD